MSDPQYTPKPWEASGRIVHRLGDRDGIIAIIMNHKNPAPDARLISAAPEMLAERRAICDCLGFAEWASPEHAEELLQELIRDFGQSAAIAKANPKGGGT